MTDLSIRPAVDAYKTLAHAFQIVCTKTTSIQEIGDLLVQRTASSFVHLNLVDRLPLNSIIGNIANLVKRRLFSLML